jgi:hypothetical protein
MKPFFTEVVRINGHPIKQSVNHYESPDVTTMADAASRAAVDETTRSGDVAVVVVGTSRGTLRKYEVEVTREVTTKTKRVTTKTKRVPTEGGRP